VGQGDRERIVADAALVDEMDAYAVDLGPELRNPFIAVSWRRQSNSDVQYSTRERNSP
jgi:hypothetical protein